MSIIRYRENGYDGVTLRSDKLTLTSYGSECVCVYFVWVTESSGVQNGRHRFAMRDPGPDFCILQLLVHTFVMSA